MINGDLFVVAGHRILNRLERDPEFVTAKTRGALQTVEIEFERNETRLQESAEGGGEDFEGESASRAGTDLEQGVSLFRRSLLVDEKTDDAIALVNCLGPFRGEAEAEAVEREVIVFSALDPPPADAVAEAGGRRRGEFARASVIAIAGLEIIGIEEPFFHREILSLVSAFWSAASLSKILSGTALGCQLGKAFPKESGSTKLNFGDVTLLNPNALVGASQVCDILSA
jgi:hypothetical protein